MRRPRVIVAVLAGTAVATATIVTTVFLPPSFRLVNVPRNLATLTHQQKVIVRLGRRHGVGSGIYYVWGGMGHGGFDCSGFVGHVLAQAGIHGIPRTSQAMWQRTGRRVPRRDLRPGDVVFMRSSGSYYAPGHVGLYLGSGKLVEYYSSGRPARYRSLRYVRDYVGAKRWWYPQRVRKRTYYPALYVARHWRLKIAGHHYDTVVFVPRGHRTFAVWKRRAILAWAHAHHFPVKGYYSHINIRLHR